MARPKQYASGRERQRAYRARLRASAAYRLGAPNPPVVAVVDHADPVGALAEWSRTALIVPPGHPRSGEPLELMPFAVDWLRESWQSHESALSTGQKKRQERKRGWGSINANGSDTSASSDTKNPLDPSADSLRRQP